LRLGLLGELVGAYTTAANQGACLKLLNLQGKMRDLMQITKLHTIFPAFDNEQEAVKSFGTAATA
jgi:anti-sigma B factor antagonist